uniref:Uncharacterized protein n=1 Tax=Ditylenchus dipsaci TaxID=166011 RepID=A0A915DAF7_9BILA
MIARKGPSFSLLIRLWRQANALKPYATSSYSTAPTASCSIHSIVSLGRLEQVRRCNTGSQSTENSGQAAEKFEFQAEVKSLLDIVASHYTLIKSYHLFFKEGIIMDKTHEVKEDISKLLLFESSNFKPGTLTSFKSMWTECRRTRKASSPIFSQVLFDSAKYII